MLFFIKLFGINGVIIGLFIGNIVDLSLAIYYCDTLAIIIDKLRIIKVVKFTVLNILLFIFINAISNSFFLNDKTLSYLIISSLLCFIIQILSLIFFRIITINFVQNRMNFSWNM